MSARPPSPRPWYVEDEDKITILAPMEFIAQCSGNATANAAHIVKCVNKFDQLLGTMREIAVRLDSAAAEVDCFNVSESRALALAAITKAETMSDPYNSGSVDHPEHPWNHDDKCPYCSANGVHNCQHLIPKLRNIVAREQRDADVINRAIDRILVLEQTINGPHGWKAEHADDMEQMTRLLRESSAARNEIDRLTNELDAREDDTDALIADMELELRSPTNPDNRERLYERARNRRESGTERETL